MTEPAALRITAPAGPRPTPSPRTTDISMDELLDVATRSAALRTEDLTIRYGGQLGLFS